MAKNPRIVLPFGGGLDRETGVMAMRPGSFEDIQNVLLHQGKAIIRPGFTTTVIPLDDEGAEVSHSLQGEALKSEKVGIVVSFQQATEKVWVHRTNAAGTIATLIGEWVHDQGGWGASPPTIVMAESYARMFMAHDKALIGDRAPTVYYDPIFGSGAVENLTADFLSVGSHNVSFRGVVRHLDYLFGWGYGDESTDRPEMVRSSGPGAPTSFAPNHYFVVGNRGVPVLNCGPVGRFLQVLKEVSGYVITGSGRDTFGVFSADPLYGCLNSALSANFGDLLLAWSSEGPRVWTGGTASEEIAIPLELGGLEPASLVPSGDVERAFAHYIPILRAIAFVFGQRAYVLTLRVEGDWKWSYWNLGFDSYCGFTLFPGQELTEAPTGFPEYSASVSAGTYSDLTIVNHDQDGDETLEAWIQEDPAGDWALNNSKLVTLDASQVIRVDDLTAGTTYNLATRYRRGALYATAYSGTPDTWPQVSRGQITTAINAPTPVSGVWSRTATAVEEILLTVTPWPGQEANDIEVFRGGGSIGTISGPHTGDAEFTDTTGLGLSGEVVNVYTFETKGGTDSPPSVELEVWSGPPGRPTIAWAQGTGPAYEVGFDTPDPTLATEIWDDYDNAGALGATALRATVSAGETTHQELGLINVPSTPGLQATVNVRQKATAFTTDDFSQYSVGATVVIVDPWV